MNFLDFAEKSPLYLGQKNDMGFIRRFRGLTPEEAGARMGVPPATVIFWETYARIPPVDAYRKIESVYNYPCKNLGYRNYWDKYEKPLYRQLDHEMQEQGMTEADIAKALNISKTYLYRAMRGRENFIPFLCFLIKRFLKTTTPLEVLFERTEPNILEAYLVAHKIADAETRDKFNKTQLRLLERKGIKP